MYNKSTSTNRLHRDTSSPKCTIRVRVQTEYIEIQVVLNVQLDYEYRQNTYRYQ